MTKGQYTQEAIGLLKQLIAIPSTSRDEREAADCLQSYMEERGIQTHRAGNNVWAIAPNFDKNLPTLLLNSHIDTVKPVTGWTFPPYTPTEQEGRLYGLGSNDAGASMVSLLQTFRHLCSHKQAYNVIFLASCEEEVSGKQGIESVLPLLPPISVAIVGEPTGMQPAIAEKGLMVLDVTAHGRAGHAAREEGDNAIYKAMKDIEWFRSYQWERISPMLGKVKMTVTQVNAGTQHNVIPESCTFVVDIRSNELYTNEELYEHIAQQIKSETKARSFRLNSSRISQEHPLVQQIVRMGRTPFGSPTLSDQALMGFPSLKIGPGDSARSHTANEYILIQEIAEAISLYQDMLDGLELM